MQLEIFFDESGKKSNKPMIMGAIAIPHNIYILDDIQKINSELQSKKYKYHFTSYNGDYSMKNRIKHLFNVLGPYLKTMRVNTLKYDSVEYTGNNPNGSLFDTMVYSKFPERIFYGLLRCKGNLMNLEANIFMEDATEYKDFPSKFKEQLNVQSLYRGERFTINECTTVPKYTEIGVEFIDILLGIIRVILNFDKIDSSTSRSIREKIKLVNELLENTYVYAFFSEIKYFEWDKTNSLKEIKFKDYLDTYISVNCKKDIY